MYGSTINSVILVFGVIVVTLRICKYYTNLQEAKEYSELEERRFNTILYVNELLTPPFPLFKKKSDYTLLLMVQNNLSYWQNLSNKYGLHNDLKNLIKKWMEQY